MKSAIGLKAMFRLAVPAALCLLALSVLAEGDKPYEFGVVTDVQYGDKSSREGRAYRKSLEKLSECVAAFNTRSLGFVVELGDLMDGYRGDAARSLADLDRMLPVLREVKAPLYHVIGNHCMNGGREAVLARLNLKQSYYDFTRPAAPGWRFVVLDGTVAGYGILGPDQTAWFKSVLAEADQAGQRVICLCHFPLLQPDGRDHRIKGKQGEQVVTILKHHPCVKAWFSGHDHRGGYVLQDGIHFINFKGMVEAVSNAYSVVTLDRDYIKIRGFGGEPSRELKVFRNGLGEEPPTIKPEGLGAKVGAPGGS